MRVIELTDFVRVSRVEDLGYREELMCRIMNSESQHRNAGKGSVDVGKRVEWGGGGIENLRYWTWGDVWSGEGEFKT